MYQVEVFFTFDRRQDAVAFGDSMLELENSATYIVRDTREPVMTLKGADVQALQNLVMQQEPGEQTQSSAYDNLRATVEDSF